MQKQTQVTLSSSALVNTAGIFRWAMDGYKFKKDRPFLLRVISESYHIPRKVAHDILTENDCLVEFIDENVSVTFFNPEKYD